MADKLTYEELEKRVVTLEKAESERKIVWAALRESEARLRRAELAAKSGNWEFNLDSKIMYGSDGAIKLYGVNKDQFEYAYIKSVPLPEYRQLLDTALKNLIENNKPYDVEFKIKTVDTGKIIDIYSTAVFDKEKKIIFGIIQDITERKRAEEALKESRRRYQDLIQNLPVGVYRNIPGPSGRFLIVNPAIAQMFGYASTEEFMQVPVAGLYQDSAARHDFTEKLISQGQVFGEELLLKKKDGTSLCGAVTAKVIRGNDGTIAYFDGFIEDVTKRKQAEEALRKSEDWLKSVFRVAPVGMGVVRDRILLDVNPRLCEMTGYTQKELIGASARVLYPNQEEFEYVGREKYRQIAKMGTGAVETHFQTKDGSVINVLLASTPMNLLNLSEGVTFTALDITERKRAEAEKEKLQAELFQAQKVEAIGRLAGGVAHDFNNMLSIIIGRAELARMKLEPSDLLYKDLCEIEAVGKRSANLTRQLMGFARKQTITPWVINLNDTIESLLKMLRQLIGEDIDLLWKPAPKIWRVKMDPAQIDQILANLVINARDAIKDVGKVTIETDNVVFDEAYCAVHNGFIPGEFTLIAVSDDGCGIDRETLPNIFEPFFTTKEIGKGTGLGLATVYGIVKQNHGFINAYSEPGRGSTFKVYLPHHVGKAARVPTKAPAEAATGGPETVLLVEDEPTLLDVAKRMLEKLGYTVLAAGTPAEAIRLAGEHAGEIHLLMTDVVMPGMNGRDLARNLLSLYPQQKCLFMSGYTANVIAHHGVLDEGVFFIQKPFSMKALAATIRQVLAQE